MKHGNAWRGGRYTNDQGYVLVWAPDHPDSDGRGYIREHRLTCDVALGHRLPAHATIHHVNGDRSDNRPGNLVVCQDRAYHKLLHQRMDALRNCGHAEWRRCVKCGRYDAPANLSVLGKGIAPYHKACLAEYQRHRRAAL